MGFSARCSSSELRSELLNTRGNLPGRFTGKRQNFVVNLQMLLGRSESPKNNPSSYWLIQHLVDFDING